MSVLEKHIEFYNSRSDRVVSFDEYMERVISFKWCQELAITTPTNKSKEKLVGLRLLYSHLNTDVSYKTLYNRVKKKGWTLLKSLEHGKTRGKKFPLSNYFHKHNTLDLPYHVFYRRVVQYNWDIEKAISTPTKKTSDRSNQDAVKHFT